MVSTTVRAFLFLSCAFLASVLAVVVSDQLTAFLILLTAGVALALYAIFLLSHLATKQQHQSTGPSAKNDNGTRQSSHLVWTTRLVGSFAAILLVAMSFFTSGGPIALATTRVIGFAAACKTLDLAVARAHKAPKRLKGKAVFPVTDQNRREYIWLLLRECRYRSFDIAVDEKRREGTTDPLWTWGPAIVLPLMAYLVPCAETRFLLGLLVLQGILEGEHYILHPSCSSQLLWQPFAAGSSSAFWRTHWQQDVASFLHSLAYLPVKLFVTPRFGRNAGRAAGVLAAFNFSGIWHAWAAAALSTTPWTTAMGMWALFMIQATWCLIENAVWKDRQGGIVQRVLTWTIAVGTAGVWLRHAEQHTNVSYIQQKMEVSV